jgi:hypothetical protein
MMSDEGAPMVRDAARRDATWGTTKPAFALESWGLVLPLVFAGNAVVATLAWFLVGLLMR